MNKFFESIKNFVKKLFGNGTFQTVLEQALRNVLAVLSVTAVDILSAEAAKKVSDIEKYNGLSGEDKRKQVLDHLLAVAANEGIKTTISSLNLIIEAAVNAIKK